VTAELTQLIFQQRPEANVIVRQL